MPLRSLQSKAPLFILISGLTLSAQTQLQIAPSAGPTLHANAEAVSVDVVVTTGNDEPVLNLHEQDFVLLEDGKPQPINLFEEHTAPAAAPVFARAALAPHVYTNSPIAPVTDVLNIVLLDSLNTPESDQAYVHKQIAAFLRDMKPDTRMAIFALNGKLHLVQGFTSDNSLLKAAINSKSASPGSNVASRTRDDDLRDKEEVAIISEMAGNSDASGQMAAAAHARTLEDQVYSQGGRRTAMTLAALQQLARSLAAVPGRKNLIWFATSFPVSIFPNGLSRQTLPNGKELESVVHQTASLLTAARVAVYPVSAQGIIVDHTTNADSAGQPLGDDFEKAPNQQSLANQSNTGAMELLARDTGGEALYTTNDLNQAMMQAIQDGSHYYTLFYTPPNTQPDGKFHRIEVKLTTGKARLAYRRGYFSDGPNSTSAPSDPLPPLLARGMPASTQIVYEAQVVPASPQAATDASHAGGNHKLAGPTSRYEVDFVIPRSAIALEPAADGMHTGKVEAALVAYDESGAAVNWTGETLGLSLNPASYAEAQRAGIPIHMQLDLPKVNIYLATGVYDLSGHKSGTLEIPLPASAGAR